MLVPSRSYATAGGGPLLRTCEAQRCERAGEHRGEGAGQAVQGVHPGRVREDRADARRARCRAGIGETGWRFAPRPVELAADR